MIASIPRHLMEGDVELGVRAVREQKLEVGASDRHWGAQLVRGVVYEPLVALEH